MKRVVIPIIAAIGLTGCGYNAQMSLAGYNTVSKSNTQAECTDINRMYTRIGLAYYAGKLSPHLKEEANRVFTPAQVVCAAPYTYTQGEANARLTRAQTTLKIGRAHV